MKPYRWALALLFSSLALAQTAPVPQKTPAKPESATSKPAAPAATPAAPADAQPSEVAPDAAVITMDGVCKTKDAKTGECKTVVTRAQFDKLVSALAGDRMSQQQIPPQAKRQLAMQYARLIQFADEAEKQGLGSGPEAQELFRFVRMQVLEQEMRRALQRKAQPTAEEIQKYYDDNPQRYAELTLQRVMVPIRPSADGKTNEAEMKKLADDLRQRAASGTDFKTLQAEAFEKAGLQNPPETKMVVQPQALPTSHQPVLQLKPGEVSQVIQDPTGLYVYKLEGKRQIPLEQAKPEIQNLLTTQKMQQEVDKVLRSATPALNPQYFGQTPAAPAGTGIRAVPGAPSSPPPSPPQKVPPPSK